MTRVEIFSDAVIAIAITLLVLELPFDKVGHGELADALGDLWPSFAAYLISFVGIGLLWLHHHAIFSAIARVDRPLLLLNLLLLFATAFLPFPTALVGDYLHEGGEDARIAMAFYSANWLVMTLAIGAMWSHAIRADLTDPELTADRAHRLLRSFRVASAAYVTFTVLALASPRASIAGYALAAAYFFWASDFRALEREVVEERAS